MCIGLRLPKSNKFTTHYLWDELSGYGDVIWESDGTNTTSYVLGGNQLISQKRGTTVSYFLPDMLGSTRALTNTTGTITASYTYTAFGDVLTQTGTPNTDYLYTGQQYDSTTDLYSLRARYYNPTDGRFLSRDTWAYNFQNPVELNRYVYAMGNPISYTDPSGYSPTIDFTKIVKRVSLVGAAGLHNLAQKLESIFFWLHKIFAEMDPFDCMITELALGADIPNCGTLFQGYPNSGKICTWCSSNFDNLGGGSSGKPKSNGPGVKGNIDSTSGNSSGSSSGEGNTITIYRAVSAAEYDDIIATKQFRPRSDGKSMDFKWFADKLEDIPKWGQKFYPSEDYYVVSAEFPIEVAETFFKDPWLDGIGPARGAFPEQLVNATINFLGLGKR